MKVLNFNRGWRFYKKGREEDALDLTLPHDAMIGEEREPDCINSTHTAFFPGGEYVYTKDFQVPDAYRNHCLTLEFEGVYQNAEVYVNGNYAGGCPYGYTQFYVPLDAHLRYGESNEIKVLADNSAGPNSRWYSGSGIYRNVNLHMGGRDHVDIEGVRITTKTSGAEAVVEVESSLSIESGGCFSLETELLFGDVQAAFQKTAVNESRMVQKLMLPKALPWSAENPNLYTCRVRLIRNETESDRWEGTFGIRTLELDAEKGLRINGTPVKLRGACIHHDNGILGAATFEAAAERRVKILKEAGYNAIRSAHNPLSKAMLAACDRQGLYVMDEAWDVWEFKKLSQDYSGRFKEHWRRDLQAMVAKDYNHPCVIMYSLGNEIQDTAFESGIKWSETLAKALKELDETRPHTIAVSLFLKLMASLGFGLHELNDRREKKYEDKKKSVNEKKAGSVWINTVSNLFSRKMKFPLNLNRVDRYTRGAFAFFDVAGYNYASSRYAMDKKRHPDRVICGSETFTGNIAKNWRLMNENAHVIGDFQWTGWDYLGEAGVGGWGYDAYSPLYKPYPALTAFCGAIDINGHPQVQAYWNRAVWGKLDKPYIGVRPMSLVGKKVGRTNWRDTDAVNSWSWTGWDNKPAEIEVYSDAHEVSLSLNRRLIARKKLKDCRARFKTRYEPGTLTAVAYDDSGRELSRSSLKSPGRGMRLAVIPEKTKLRADGADLAYLNIRICDEKGIVRVLDDRKVTVTVEGAGSLQGFGSANPVNPESFTGTEHRSYYGRILAVVRSGFEAGEIRVQVACTGCAPEELRLKVIR